MAWCSSTMVGPEKRLVPAKDQPRAKGGKGIEDMPVAWLKDLLIWSISLEALAHLETFVASFFRFSMADIGDHTGRSNYLLQT